MYRIERKDDKVIVRRLGIREETIFIADKTALIIYRKGAEANPTQVGDLNDSDLLLALVNAVELKDFAGNR